MLSTNMHLVISAFVGGFAGYLLIILLAATIGGLGNIFPIGRFIPLTMFVISGSISIVSHLMFISIVALKVSSLGQNHELSFRTFSTFALFGVLLTLWRLTVRGGRTR